MTKPLRLGIAGLGTVGVGVVRIIRQHAAVLEARTGRPITISAVSARSKDKDRGVPLADYAWEDDPVALAKRDDVLLIDVRTHARPRSKNDIRVEHDLGLHFLQNVEQVLTVFHEPDYLGILRTLL